MRSDRGCPAKRADQIGGGQRSGSVRRREVCWRGVAVEKHYGRAWRTNDSVVDVRGDHVVDVGGDQPVRQRQGVLADLVIIPAICLRVTRRCFWRAYQIRAHIDLCLVAIICGADRRSLISVGVSGFPAAAPADNAAGVPCVHALHAIIITPATHNVLAFIGSLLKFGRGARVRHARLFVTGKTVATSSPPWGRPAPGERSQPGGKSRQRPPGVGFRGWIPILFFGGRNAAYGQGALARAQPAAGSRVGPIEPPGTSRALASLRQRSTPRTWGAVAATEYWRSTTAL